MNLLPRNPWPVSIAIFFAIAIAFFVSFVAWAMHQRDDLVSPDYYEREVRYQSQLDSMNRTHALDPKSVVTFEAVRQTIVINLPEARSPDTTGSIQLYRPSDAQLDREFPLALNADGVQRLGTSQLREGLWKVRIKWNSHGQDFFLDQPIIVTAE